MAVFSFEWKSGPSDAPLAMSFVDDLVIYETASSTWKKGYPLGNDTSESDAGALYLGEADEDDATIFIAATDAVNYASAVDLTQPGVHQASLPYIARPGDIWSVTVASAGANVATSPDYIGQYYGWLASTETGETKKAVLDVAETTNAQWLVIGFDDRDAVATSGGRMLVMFAPWATVTVATL